MEGDANIFVMVGTLHTAALAIPLVLLRLFHAISIKTGQAGQDVQRPVVEVPHQEEISVMVQFKQYLVIHNRAQTPVK